MKLVIEIRQTGGEASGKKNSIDESEEKGAFQKGIREDMGKLRNPIGAIKSEINEFAGAKGVAVAGAVIAVAQQVLGQISAGVNFAISGVGMTTGNSALQDTIAREQEKIQESVNMVKGVMGGAAAGAVMGAAFGPIGALVGGVGGAVFGGIKAEIDKQRKYEERRREYEFEAWKFDTARTVSLQRAGITVGGGRLHQY